MSREHKTGKKHRSSYIYYAADGTKIILRPGEDEVTETFVELLHTMDDEEHNTRRRNEYRIKIYLDAQTADDTSVSDDRKSYLADETYNPEQILLDLENEAEIHERQNKIRHAIEQVSYQQKELFRKIYIENQSKTHIASEEAVTEAAIRGRDKKLRNRIRKILTEDK